VDSDIISALAIGYCSSGLRGWNCE